MFKQASTQCKGLHMNIRFCLFLCMWYAAWMFQAENGRVMNLHYMSSAALSRSSVLGQIEPGTVSMMRWSWGQVKSDFLSCLQMKKGSSRYIWWHFSKTNMWVCFVFRKQTDLLKHRWCLSSNKQQQEPVMVMFFCLFFYPLWLKTMTRWDETKTKQYNSEKKEMRHSKPQPCL